MRHLKSTVAGLALMALLASGCISVRKIATIEEVPGTNVTLLETREVRTVIPLLWYVGVHQFWQCTDSGPKLTCRKACGQGTDLECPAGVGLY